jgi:hypothetical protein
MDDRPKDDAPAQAGDGDDGGDKLDPALIARLEAWFGAPTTAQAPPPPPARRRSAEEIELERARRRALEALEHSALAARLEQRGHSLATLVRPLPPVRLSIERSVTKFDLARWRLLETGPREVERPDDLWDALAERTPQALLRDLHRPVMYFDEVEFEQIEVFPPGSTSTGEVRESMAADYRWTPEEPQLEFARADLAALRHRLRHEAWGEAPAEIARIRDARDQPAATAEVEREVEREPSTEELIALFEPPR